MISPADISWSDDTLVQPDVFVVPRAEAADGTWTAVRTLLLVVEVLSPSTARYDRFNKRLAYRDVGVPTYWILDADARVAEVWTPDVHVPRIEREVLRWHSAGASAPLVVELAALFAE
jgi:Uma2 family endonuclease